MRSLDPYPLERTEETYRHLGAAVHAMGAHCACLPAHASGWSEVEGMLQETAALVGRLCRGGRGVTSVWVDTMTTTAVVSSCVYNPGFGQPPSIVLVARSARDGYTPLELVDAIQVIILPSYSMSPPVSASDRC